ncbi:hypothetical protein ACIQ7D_30145 [Streptomyces sp. NPDC096310]|uniref:hypothetical protein n=1 Tax=Streptomyces sp. NPDC096310 TaxID=3366082 RepID=UPI003821CF11
MTVTPFTNRDTMTRRRVLGAVVASGAAAEPLAAAGPARAVPARTRQGATTPAPARLVLPGPTGPYSVGTVELHLVDASRPDPDAGPGHHRQLMPGVW